MELILHYYIQISTYVSLNVTYSANQCLVKLLLLEVCVRDVKYFTQKVYNINLPLVALCE